MHRASPPCPIYNSQSLGVMWHAMHVPMAGIMILARALQVLAGPGAASSLGWRGPRARRPAMTLSVASFLQVTFLRVELLQTTSPIANSDVLVLQCRKSSLSLSLWCLQFPFSLLSVAR
jgi:hypothetical protein